MTYPILHALVAALSRGLSDDPYRIVFPDAKLPSDLPAHEERHRRAQVHMDRLVDQHGRGMGTGRFHWCSEYRNKKGGA